MNYLNQFLGFFKLRRARKLGEAAGAKWFQQRESNWEDMKRQAQTQRGNRAALRALFIGWMQGVHDSEVKMLKAVNISEVEFRSHWEETATHFCARFESEVIAPLCEGQPDAGLSAEDLARIVLDVSDLAQELAQQVALQQETALDQAVRAIRSAEQAGRLEVDQRSDEDLKESIRQLWEDEIKQARG